MTSISFVKMHALGNDFVVIDQRQSPHTFSTSQLIHLADRHRGVGCDQILILTTRDTVDAHCRIYNQDGSEAEQCGNGLRCIARYLSKQNNQSTFSIATLAGVFKLEIIDEQLVRMNMGIPKLNAQPLTLDNGITVHEIQFGNPHAVTKLNHNPLNDAGLTELGHHISTHPHFKSGVNVGFVHVVNEAELILKTYERGSGWTLSCGSNAAASAAYFFHLHPEKNALAIQQQLGIVYATRNTNNEIELTGTAEMAFTGTIKMTPSQLLK